MFSIGTLKEGTKMNNLNPKQLKIQRTFNAVVRSVVRSILLFSIAIIIIYPIFYMLSMSLRPLDEIWDPTVVWIPRRLTLENIIQTASYMKYFTVSMNSLVVTLVSSIATIVSCALAGYGFARFKFRLRELLFMMVIFTILVPPQTIIFPSYLNFWQFDFFGLGYIAVPFIGKPFTISLINTQFTLIVPAMFGSGIRSGLYIYIFRQFFRGLPKEMEDAAYIDGCGTFKTFIRIIVPNSLLTMVIVLLFSIVWYWNDYYFSIIYMNSANTVSTALAALPALFRSLTAIGGDLVKFDAVQTSAMIQSGCLLAIAPVIVVYAVLQRYFVQGIEATGLVE